MTIRRDRLNRLVIGSACGAEWEEMRGDERRRHCSECQRDVHDFERMTVDEIWRRMEASGGQLCARLTREGGELVTAHGVPAPIRSTLLRSAAWRRVSPIAATFVTASLGAGFALAQERAPVAGATISSSVAGETGASSATKSGGERAAGTVPGPVPNQTAHEGGPALHGRLTGEKGKPLAGAAVVARNRFDGEEVAASTGRDGAFSFRVLRPGIYDLRGELDGFQIEGVQGIAFRAGVDRSFALKAIPIAKRSVTLGMLMKETPPLRRLVAESALVVAAQVGASVVVGGDADSADVATELQIESLLKGEVAGSRVTVHRTVDRGTAPHTAAAPLEAGERILAFLQPSPERSGTPGTSFETADFRSGIIWLDDATGDAYVERLGELARLEARADRLGESDPAAQMEWLVATVENYATREVATTDLALACWAVEKLAPGEAQSVEEGAATIRALAEEFRAAGGKAALEPPLELVGASLTPAHRHRLEEALRRTETLRDGDLSLFYRVQEWNEEGARAWLARRLRSDQVYEMKTWWFSGLAAGFKSYRLGEMVRQAERREAEIIKAWPADGPAAGEAERRKALTALRRDLVFRFAAEISPLP